LTLSSSYSHQPFSRNREAVGILYLKQQGSRRRRKKKNDIDHAYYVHSQTVV
jgi:hypothetical protein